MYHNTASGLASLGRGGDDTLVHMNKGEVAALNALNYATNNRPLTVNPHTGLPEAMDLTEILLGLGLAAATVFTGGAAAAAAPALLGVEAGGAAALATGATAGALTGAGLGAAKNAATGKDPGMGAAFGAGSGALGGLGGAMGVAGEGAAAGEGAVADATSSAIPKDPSALASEVNNVPTVMTQADKTALLATDNANALGLSPNSYQGLLDSTFPSVGTDITVPTSGDIVAKQAAEMGINTGATNTGLAAITPPASTNIPEVAGATTQPGPFEQSFNAMASKFTGDVPLSAADKALMGAGIASAGLEDSMNQQAQMQHQNAQQAEALVNQYKAAGVDVSTALPPSLLAAARKPKHFAVGGSIRDVQGLESISPSAINQQPMTNFYPQSMIPQAQPLQRSMPIRHEVIGYADGGPIGYGFAEGGDTGGGDEGLLHGPGTGQSDGIMGLIQGEQGQEPVRLADSEFVIPADVVAALGDGSTKAGARILYDMLDRIRQQAYGHIRQANPVDPSKVLPA